MLSPKPKSPSKRQIVILIGVGGPSCSGKTSLTQHLARVLDGASEVAEESEKAGRRKKVKSRTMIIHQDDFAPPQEQIPFHPDFPTIQDWDHPPTAVDWPLFRRALLHAKETGELLPDHNSHDHLNVMKKIDVGEPLVRKWKERFEGLLEKIEEGIQDEEEKVEVVFVLVDGFLLYWDKQCTNLYDVLLFLRVPFEVLKARREERQQYVTQNPTLAAAGDVWVDPPHYFENIVYPAYVFAHKDMFTNEDVEKGDLKSEFAAPRGDKGLGMKVFMPLEGSEGMRQIVDESCEAIFEEFKRRI